MSDVTQILSAIEHGDPSAAEQLLPLVYDELLKLAAARLAYEKPGQTLQATALVHEAYLRLVDGKDRQQWDNRWHFYAAAAEAMRRIVLNVARDKKRLKRGGDLRRIDLDQIDLANDAKDDELIALAEALEDLEREDTVAAQVVKLRFFAGLKQGEVAAALGISLRSVERQWAFAQAWLYDRMRHDASTPGG
jgi:RNA polymerase sigma factor (TIGR02999 family)